MKIAFIVGRFPTLQETFVLNQITGLLDKGYDVKVFATFNPFEKKIHKDVIKYNLIDKCRYYMHPNIFILVVSAIFLIITNLYKRRFSILKSLNIFNYGMDALSLRLLYLYVLFMDKRYDVIHCHFGTYGILGAYLKKIGIKGKLITTFHGFDLSSFIMKDGKKKYKVLFQYGDIFLPISEYWKKELIELGCSKDKIIVHRMGIDLNKFTFVERKIAPGNLINILTVGRLVEKKGHEYSIKAIGKVISKHKNLKYIIAGNGPLIDELKLLTIKLGLIENIKFLGSVDQSEVIKLYQQAHLFILSSVTAKNGNKEGIPVVLMEAAASGLPVISTYHSGIPELVIDGETGLLAPEKNVDILAEKIGYLIEHPEIWIRMGRKGMKVVKHEYNIKELNKNLEDIYYRC